MTMEDVKVGQYILYRDNNERLGIDFWLSLVVEISNNSIKEDVVWSTLNPKSAYVLGRQLTPLTTFLSDYVLIKTFNELPKEFLI